MTETDDLGEEVRLSTVIRLPRQVKNHLRILCARRGLAMRDYVEQLVRTALGVQVLPPGRAAMGTRNGASPEEFEESQRCKYGCRYWTKSKPGLSQHEENCTLQRCRSAQERARKVEAERASSGDRGEA